MADIKISELGAASAVNATDLFPMTSSGVTVKATAQQIKNYIGVGNLSDLDTTDKTSAVNAINEVNTKVSKTEDLISIVENGNTCTHTGGITKGQYVNWKGNLYTADSNISVGATFASSGGSKNLTAVVNGGLNQFVTEKGSFSITVSNTGGENWIFRNGNIRTLQMRIIGTSLGDYTDTKIGKMNESGDMPNYRIFAQGYALDSSGYPKHNVMVKLETNGDVYVLNVGGTAYGIVAIVPYMV